MTSGGPFPSNFSKIRRLELQGQPAERGDEMGWQRRNNSYRYELWLIFQTRSVELPAILRDFPEQLSAARGMQSFRKTSLLFQTFSWTAPAPPVFSLEIGSGHRCAINTVAPILVLPVHLLQQPRAGIDAACTDLNFWRATHPFNRRVRPQQAASPWALGLKSSSQLHPTVVCSCVRKRVWWVRLFAAWLAYRAKNLVCGASPRDVTSLGAGDVPPGRAPKLRSDKQANLSLPLLTGHPLSQSFPLSKGGLPSSCTPQKMSCNVCILARCEVPSQLGCATSLPTYLLGEMSN